MIAHCDVIVSTDIYVDDSVKNLERKSRGVADKLIVKGPSTRKPKDWKAFLQNEDNKNNHVTTIGDSDSLLIFFKEGRAYDINTQMETTELQSDQEETDSRVVLYCMYAAEKGYQYVRVKTPNSDILWILMFHANKIKAAVLYETGHGNKKRLLNITELSQHYVNKCDALLGLHAFTGCDVTSAFKGVKSNHRKRCFSRPLSVTHSAA